jgi:hypothetical protein
MLRNDHGIFVDITGQLHPDLEYPGLVNSAQWIDVDNDHKPDLVLAGEWMPIRIFKNEGKTFREVTKAFGLEQSNGWWNCLRAADINQDGYMDFIAGNTGMNSYFQPTHDQPVQIVAKDFDNNGSIDPIVTYYSVPENERFMVHNRLVVIDQIPGMKKRFETFAQFATTSFDDAFKKNEREGAYVGSAYTLASAMFVNEQGKRFRSVSLPEIAQLSTINDILAEDINHDGHVDLLLIGNNYSQETLFGHYDASIGTVMLGDGQLNWPLFDAGPTQFIADGDAKYLRLLRTAGDPILVIANNNGPLQCYRVPGGISR